MRLNTRPAVTADASAVEHLAKLLAPGSNLRSGATDYFRPLLESDGHRVWVAETEDGIVGWLHAFIAWRVGVAPFIEIGGLVVSEGCRRIGVGSKLIAEVNAWARQKGLAVRVRCHSERDATHSFYKSQGFSLLKQQYVFESKVRPTT